MDAQPATAQAAEQTIALIGIGDDEQFAIARAACSGTLKWRGTYPSIAALADVQIDEGCILLIDEDTASPDTIDLLEQNGEPRRGALSILQTSRAEVRHVVSAMKRGVADVLIKPCTPGRLRSAVFDARHRFCASAAPAGRMHSR